MSAGQPPNDDPSPKDELPFRVEPPEDEPSVATPTAVGKVPEPTGSTAETTRAVGRGGLAILGAKIYFLVTGLVQQILLRWVLGLSGYGAYSTASSVASITYNPAVQTSIQGVSRVVSAASGPAMETTLRRTLLYHTFVSLLLAAGFVLVATPVAAALGAPHIETTLRILGLVVGIYGIYAPLVGALNGLRRFASQAALDVLAATLRTVGLVAGAYVALVVFPDRPMIRVEGAVAGFAGSALIVLAVAVKATGLGKSGGSAPAWREYARFVVPIWGGQLLLNLLFQADALLLRRFAAEAAIAAQVAPQAADPIVGAYRAAQLFCFLPYQLLMSVTFVLFPLLARAHAEENAPEVERYVRDGVRIATILSGLMVSVLLALPHGLIAAVFGADAAVLGGDAMRILAIGLAFFAVLGVMTSALNSLGAERGSLLIIGLAALLVGSLCFAIARGAPLGEQLLVRTALATTLALCGASAAAAILLKSTAGAVLGWACFLRTVLAVAITAGCLHWLFTPDGLGSLRSTLITLAGAFVAPFLFLGVLRATGELGADDWQKVRTIVRPRGRGGS